MSVEHSNDQVLVFASGRWAAFGTFTWRLPHCLWSPLLPGCCHFYRVKISQRCLLMHLEIAMTTECHSWDKLALNLLPEQWVPLHSVTLRSFLHYRFLFTFHKRGLLPKMQLSHLAVTKRPQTHWDQNFKETFLNISLFFLPCKVHVTLLWTSLDDWKWRCYR